MECLGAERAVRLEGGTEVGRDLRTEREAGPGEGWAQVRGVLKGNGAE